MKQLVNYKILSPIGTNEFPCFGGHHMFHTPKYKEKPFPYAFALKVGIKNNQTMLVKIPISKEQSVLTEQLFKKFDTCYPVSVKFKNLCCYYYEYGANTGYTATADKFEIQEDENNAFK